MVMCCFCGSLIHDYQSNNPYPITPEAEKGTANSKERCCNFCNSAYVLPIRIKYGYNREKYLEALERKKRVLDVSLVLDCNILDEDTSTGIENLFCKLEKFKKSEDDINHMMECADEDNSNALNELFDNLDAFKHDEAAINRMLECADEDNSGAVDCLFSNLDRYLDSKDDIARMISDANE